MKQEDAEPSAAVGIGNGEINQSEKTSKNYRRRILAGKIVRTFIVYLTLLVNVREYADFLWNITVNENSK